MFVFVLYFCMVCLCFMKNKNMKKKKVNKSFTVFYCFTAILHNLACDTNWQKYKANIEFKLEPIRIVDTNAYLIRHMLTGCMPV